MQALRFPSALNGWTAVKLNSQRRPRSKPKTQVSRAESSDNFRTVMCYRVTEPKIALLPMEPEQRITATNVIVDGSAFKVPGEIVTGEFFKIIVDDDMDCGFYRALQQQMFKSLRDVQPGDDPVYYVAVVQPEFYDTCYLYDIEGLQFYLACYRKNRFTLKRAIFGPELLEELRDVLFY